MLAQSGKALDIPSIHPNRLKFVDQEYSKPLGVFSHPSEIYGSMEIAGNCSLERIEELLTALPPHSVPVADSEGRLYLCHDMKGGYKEDLFSDHNSIATDMLMSIAYRPLHL